MTIKLRDTRDPYLIEQTVNNNYAAWGSPLSLGQYTNREILLRQTKFAESLITWILIDDEDPTDILCACETYERPCMAKVSNDTIQGSCFAIASVYTPQAQRRKGYAKTMMRLLLPVLKSKQGSVASILYSDIGPEFYSSLGWKAQQSVSLVLDLSDDPRIDAGFLGNKLLCYINNKESKRILGADSKQMQLEFALKENDSFMIIPTPEALEWNYQRSVFYTHALKSTEQVIYTGSKIIGSSDYITWTHDIEDSTLYVTHVKSSDENNIKLLLASTIKEAKNWKFNKIELWDPSKDLQRWAQKHWNFQAVQRNINISSLNYWGSKLEDVDLQWLYNEQYSRV